MPGKAVVACLLLAVAAVAVAEQRRELLGANNDYIFTAPATTGQLSEPRGMMFRDGLLYIVDQVNGLMRWEAPGVSGVTYVYQGSGPVNVGNANNPKLVEPNDVCAERTSNPGEAPLFYVADMGSGTSMTSPSAPKLVRIENIDGPLPLKRGTTWWQPLNYTTKVMGCVVDNEKDVYVGWTDPTTNSAALILLDRAVAGQQDGTVWTGTRLDAVAFDAGTNTFYVASGSEIWYIQQNSPGSFSTPALLVNASGPTGFGNVAYLNVAPGGDLLVVPKPQADQNPPLVPTGNAERLFRLSKNGATYTPVTGQGVGSITGNGGLAIYASLLNPRGVAASPDGTIFVGQDRKDNANIASEVRVITSLIAPGLDLRMPQSTTVLALATQPLYGGPWTSYQCSIKAVKNQDGLPIQGAIRSYDISDWSIPSDCYGDNPVLCPACQFPGLLPGYTYEVTVRAIGATSNTNNFTPQRSGLIQTPATTKPVISAQPIDPYSATLNKVQDPSNLMLGWTVGRYVFTGVPQGVDTGAVTFIKTCDSVPCVQSDPALVPGVTYMVTAVTEFVPPSVAGPDAPGDLRYSPRSDPVYMTMPTLTGAGLEAGGANLAALLNVKFGGTPLSIIAAANRPEKDGKAYGGPWKEYTFTATPWKNGKADGAPLVCVWTKPSCQVVGCWDTPVDCLFNKGLKQKVTYRVVVVATDIRGNKTPPSAPAAITMPEFIPQRSAVWSDPKVMGFNGRKFEIKDLGKVALVTSKDFNVDIVTDYLDKKRKNKPGDPTVTVKVNLPNIAGNSIRIKTGADGRMFVMLNGAEVPRNGRKVWSKNRKTWAQLGIRGLELKIWGDTESGGLVRVGVTHHTHKRTGNSYLNVAVHLLQGTPNVPLGGRLGETVGVPIAKTNPDAGRKLMLL